LRNSRSYPANHMQDKPVRPIVSGGSPRRARIPLHRAQRWLAEGENGRVPGVQVFVTQTAFKAINNHANSDLDNEVGGWLAGRWCRDIDTKVEYVVVEALLPAQQVRSGSTFLTFTHDSQVAMLSALEERYAKKGIVGWYHTHPRMGLFLSGYDSWLHDHFFPHPWQVALVVEPHSHTGGFFIRKGDQELDTRRYYGFYELHNRRHESIVDWQNLRLEKKAEEAKSQENKQVSKTEIKIPKKEPKPVQIEKKKIEIQKPEPQPGAELSMSSIPEEKTVEPVKEKPVAEANVKIEKTIAPKEKPVINVAIKKTETRQPVLKRFESPRPPAKVNLQKKEEKKSESNPEINTSKEAKP
jgi:proteasome lid subunit RPN8/RPN11